MASREKKTKSDDSLLVINQEDEKYIDEQHSHLRPILRMYLSVDLVNSTAFKQKGSLKADDKRVGRERYAPWVSSIAKFYRDFPKQFSANLTNVTNFLLNNQTYSGSNVPKLWKANGDELIYVVDLSHSMQPKTLLVAWVLAIQSYRKELKKTGGELDLKSACWLAGFPLQNSEIFFRESILKDEKIPDDVLENQIELANEYYSLKDKKGRILRDFVGPSIDTGFRLASLATPRKLVISLDLALMLASDPKTPPELDRLVVGLRGGREQKFFFEGRKELKGVMSGVPYPVFWLDVAEKELEEFDRLDDELQKRVSVPPGTVFDFCEEFFKQVAKGNMRPFIFRDKNGKFTTPHGTNYMKHYRDFIEKLGAQRAEITKIDHELVESVKAPDRGNEVTVEDLLRFVGNISRTLKN